MTSKPTGNCPECGKPVIYRRGIVPLTVVAACSHCGWNARSDGDRDEASGADQSDRQMSNPPREKTNE